MPCNIGYKSYERVTIPAPQPQVFSEKSEAPEIDAELLEKLGVEDSEFLEWVSELNVKPLLEEALSRALAKTSSRRGIDFTINAKGMLEANGKFISSEEKKRMKEVSATVSKLWQFEILGIVAELLDYTVNITQKGDLMTLEAEEAGKSHPCDYIKVSRKGDQSEITFEHFKSSKALDLATAKFKALARKLGVKIIGRNREVVEGDPYPTEVISKTGHRHKH